jgi:formate hydrogenlyase subunit 3/multisubunit Na+/H+ antiporter MnhD subunit
MNIFFETIGVLGLVILLLAFLVNVRRRTRKRVMLYNTMQFFGACLLCIYAYINGIMLFVLLQSVWALIALFFIYEQKKEQSGIKLSKKKK